MAQSSIFYLPELLEQILHFLAIDKFLYSTLYVSWLWYRCDAPILWKRVELSGDEDDNRSRLERFIKLVYGEGWKPIYSSKLTYLKISDYQLSNRKIKTIVRTFPNIIHLDFEESMEWVGKVLKLIAELYPDLKYLNISARCFNFPRHIRHICRVRVKNDIGLCAIANSCHKLEYLNISHRVEFTEILICNVIHSYPRLQ